MQCGLSFAPLYFQHHISPNRAVSIDKARYPLQIPVIPDALVLYVLILLIHIAKLANYSVCQKLIAVNKDGWKDNS